MRKCFWSLALLLSMGSVSPVEALEAVVELTEEQARQIGIRTAMPEITSKVALSRAPARISLPPKNEYIASATQAGLISKVDVAIGVRVKAGQVLAQIQSSDLLGLQREILDAMIGFNLSQAKLRRDQTLLDEGIISTARWQETRADFDRAAAALREAEQLLVAAGLSNSEIQSLKATRRLTSTLNVRSPIDGVILERMAVVGQRVDLLTPLFRVGKLDELWVEIDVPQERMGEIRMGDSVVIENTPLNARITQISQNVNPASQSVLVRAVIAGQTADLRPGQHVNVQLLHASADKLFRLPITALVSHDGQDYVFVRVPDGFAARPVAVAGKEEHQAVIRSGLNGDEAVAVQGVAALKASWVGIGSAE